MSELRDAFREAVDREFASVPQEWELDYVFSARFERKMRRLIHAQAHGYWNLVNTSAKRVAIAAAILVMLLSSVMAIKPVRERVIRFFVEVYEEYFEIRFGEEEKNDLDPTPRPMERYTLTELPEGYEEYRYVEAEHILFTDWKNKQGLKITLQQETGTQEVTLNSWNKESMVIKYGELSIAYQGIAEVSVFLWEQDGYVFSLSIADDIPLEEAMEIIGSVKKIE